MIWVILTLCFAAVSAQTCTEPDSLYADPNQCDAYVQCIDGVPTEQLCPDGLVFNENVQNANFPCSYPSEVDCGSRTKLQPAQPTENCAHLWGYFGSGDRSNCGVFWNCVGGREYQFTCPKGLAFSSFSYACEWPDKSPDCDVEDYLGFSCPAVRDETQVEAVGIPRYASPRDCRTFFLCIGTSPRLQECELGYVYNGETYTCEEPENVQGCQSYYPPEELASIREKKARALEAQERRLREYRERFERLNQ